VQRMGGNSEKASSGMNAAKTKAQAKLWLKDSVEEFYRDTIESGKGLSNPTLVDVLTKQSAEAHEFLTDLGIDLSGVTKLGGHSRARTHHPRYDSKEVIPKNVGSAIISTLYNYLEKTPTGRLDLWVNSQVKSLIVEDGRVVGVKCHKQMHNDLGAPSHHENVELRGDAVILATGGYSRAEDLLRQYVPSIVDLPTTNGPHAEGDGIKMAQALNASIIQMDQVQVHPTSFVMPKDPFQKTKFLAPEALRGLGGILINDEGKRFVNELDTRDRVTEAIFKNCKRMKVKDPSGKTVEGPVRAFLLMTDDSFREYVPGKFYKAKGFTTAYLGVEELAIGMRVPFHNLEQTLIDYNDCFDRKGINCREPFGKKDFPTPTRDNDVYQVMMITPAIHYTMGGLEIDEESRVLRYVTSNATDSDGVESEVTTKEVIPGLLAAGEVTGGVHGANRLGGNSLLECVVFGRIAGRNAARGDNASSTESDQLEVEEEPSKTELRDEL